MHTLFPEYLQFYPTFRCNRRCGFCFNRGLAADSETTIEIFERLAGKISAIGIKELDILGGEPTLHPGISEIIGIALDNGLKINLSTNGSNVSRLNDFSEAYDRELLRIGISINDDSVAENLDEYIIRHRPLIKSLFRKKGIIPEAAYKYLEAPGIKYRLLYMDAVALGDLAGIVPFFEFHEKLSGLKNRHENIEGVFCSGFIPDAESSPFLKSVRCPAGTTKLSAMPDGSVFPCYLLFRHREFMLGNLIHDDFKTIWESPVLDYFRTFGANNCRNTRCTLFDKCHGGCPAVSLLICNDINAPDPRCGN